MSKKPPRDRSRRSVTPGPADDPTSQTPATSTQVLGRRAPATPTATEPRITEISPSARLAAAIAQDISAPPPLMLLHFASSIAWSK